MSAVMAPRTQDEILCGIFSGLLPQGWAWPAPDGSNLGALFAAFSGVVWECEQFVAQLGLEISPAQSTLLLSDYEAVLGSDPCGTDPATMALAARQAWDNGRWIGSAGVSYAFFERLAASYGVTIGIDELEPAVCGEAVCGADVCSQLTDRFVWVVTLPNATTGLECPIRRNNPPDLTVVFQYADAA